MAKTFLTAKREDESVGKVCLAGRHLNGLSFELFGDDTIPPFEP
jgi:hypothetical protein